MQRPSPIKSWTADGQKCAASLTSMHRVRELIHLIRRCEQYDLRMDYIDLCIALLDTSDASNAAYLLTGSELQPGHRKAVATRSRWMAVCLLLYAWSALIWLRFYMNGYIFDRLVHLGDLNRTTSLSRLWDAPHSSLLWSFSLVYLSRLRGGLLACRLDELSALFSDFRCIHLKKANLKTEKVFVAYSAT